MYEATFWDYYGWEFDKLAKKFDNKFECMQYANFVNNNYSIFKTIIYHNNREVIRL